MALKTYYPQYHSLVETPGTPSRMPAFLWQTGHVAAYCMPRYLPTWVYPQLNGKKRGKMIPAKVALGPNLNNPRPLALQPPGSGQSYLPAGSRGKFVAPSMAAPSAALRPCS